MFIAKQSNRHEVGGPILKLLDYANFSAPPLEKAAYIGVGGIKLFHRRPTPTWSVVGESL